MSSMTSSAGSGGAKPSKNDCCIKYADYKIRTDMEHDLKGNIVLVVNCYCGYCGSLILKTDCTNKYRGPHAEGTARGNKGDKRYVVAKPTERTPEGSTGTSGSRAGPSLQKIVTSSKFFARLRLKRNRLKRINQATCGVCGREWEDISNGEVGTCDTCNRESHDGVPQPDQDSPPRFSVCERTETTIGSAPEDSSTPLFHGPDGRSNEEIIPNIQAKKKQPDPKLAEPVVYHDPNMKKLAHRKKLKSNKSKASLNTEISASKVDANNIDDNVEGNNEVESCTSSGQNLNEKDENDSYIVVRNDPVADKSETKKEIKGDMPQHSESAEFKRENVSESEGSLEITDNARNDEVRGITYDVNETSEQDSEKTIDTETIIHKESETSQESYPCGEEFSTDQSRAVPSSRSRELNCKDERISNDKVCTSDERVDCGLGTDTDEGEAPGITDHNRNSGTGSDEYATGQARLVRHDEENGHNDDHDGIDHDDTEYSIYNNQSIYDAYRSDVDDELCESQQHLQAEKLNNAPEVPVVANTERPVTATLDIVSHSDSAVIGNTFPMSEDSGSKTSCEEQMNDREKLSDVSNDKQNLTVQSQVTNTSESTEKLNNSGIKEESIVHVPTAKKLRRNTSKADIVSKLDTKYSTVTTPAEDTASAIVHECTTPRDKRTLERESLYDIATAWESFESKQTCAKDIKLHDCHNVEQNTSEERSVYLDALHNDAMSGYITREPGVSKECHMANCHAQCMCGAQCMGDRHCSCEMKPSCSDQCCDGQRIRRTKCICSDYVRCNEHSVYETHDVYRDSGGYSVHSVYSQHTVYNNGEEKNIYEEQGIYDLYTAYDTDDDSLEKRLSITYMEKKLRKKNRYFFLDNVYNSTPADKEGKCLPLRLFRGNPIC